jgi:hypothetical protein
MASRTAKWILAKNAGSTEHGDALGGAPLAMVGFLGTNAVGDEAGPFALPEGLETMRTAVRHDGAKGKPTWPTNAALLHKR